MTKKSKIKIADYIFWIAFIFFTNPGAILQAIGENSGTSGINVTDLLFFILCLCFISVFNKSNYQTDKSFLQATKYLIIFLCYYVLVFGYFVPLFKDNPFYSLVTTLIKIRHGFMNIAVVIMVFQFYLRSRVLFVRYFYFSSIVVIILFLMTVLLGLDILPLKVSTRGFIEIDRIIMENYGLLPFLIHLGVTLLVFKFKLHDHKKIIIGASLMYLVWILSLFRRHIFGTIIVLLLATLLFNYIQGKNLFPIKKIFSAFVYLMIIGLIVNFTFPKYIDAGIQAGYQTIYTIQHGKNTTGNKDARMGLGKEFMQNTIKENYVFGTGFDNRWRTGEGDRSGFEAADYPFLGAIAMTGIVGLLFFLPIYILLIKMLYADVKFLRKYKYDRYSYDTFIMISFVIYFIYDLLQYMNWFLPVSLFSTINGKNWYIFFALYLGSRHVFYENVNNTEHIRIKLN